MLNDSMIKFLGQKLAEKINKKVKLCTNFIRLSIRDTHGNAKDLDFQKIKTTISKGLKKRLENINIPNVDDIIS